MNNVIESQISQYISGKLIKNRIILSEAFNMRCEKISLDNNETFVIKYYKKKSATFNSIVSESNSLTYLLKKFPLLFPSIKYKSEDLLIIDYIEHNNIKGQNYQIDLAKQIIKLHSITNNKYGFKFDAQIGGLRQSNLFNSNWVNFFGEKRLNMIFEEINKKDPMPSLINNKIEKLISNLKNYLPHKPNISLLHGDLWEGNILFHNKKLVSFIDPGIYFGHNELEVAYLTWFKLVDDIFLNYYSNFIKIDKDFHQYEPVYQLYFSLLNVHLWDRDFYMKDVNNLLNKLF